MLEVLPTDGHAKSHVGFILKSLDKLNESIPYLTEGINSGDPDADNGRFYFHLGDAYTRLHKPDEVRTKATISLNGQNDPFLCCIPLNQIILVCGCIRLSSLITIN